MILWTGKQATCAGEWASSLLEDVFTVFDDLAPHRRCAKYVPVPKEVIDLTNVPSEQDRDPIVELLKATEEFEALSPAVSFIEESTPSPAAPGCTQRNRTKNAKSKQIVPKVATAAKQTMQVYPAKAATPAKERKHRKRARMAVFSWTHKDADTYERKKLRDRARKHAMREARKQGMSRIQQFEVGRAAYNATA